VSAQRGGGMGERGGRHQDRRAQRAGPLGVGVGRVAEPPTQVHATDPVDDRGQRVGNVIDRPGVGTQRVRVTRDQPSRIMGVAEPETDQGVGGHGATSTAFAAAAA
jgi:hypothetical protein